MPEAIPAETNLEIEIVRIWEHVLQRMPIGIHDDFFDLGGTSVQAARIFAGIEERFHKRLPLSSILGASTIEQLAALLLPGKERDRKAHVAAIQSGGEKPALYCIGEEALWRPVAECLGADQPVFCVGLEPGAVEQTKGPNYMEKLARHMMSALCEKQPQGPYYLGGFCRDGVFACEVARQLRMYGEEVGLLVLVEPFKPCQNTWARVAMGLRRAIFRVGYRFGEMRRLGIGEFPRYARRRWKGFRMMLADLVWRNSARLRVRKRQAGGAPDLDQMLFVAASSYKPKPLACPTVIFRSADWPMLSAGDPYFGWRELLTGRTETHVIPGDHQGIFREPNVRVLAGKLRDCLRSAGQTALAEPAGAPSPSYGLIADGERARS